MANFINSMESVSARNEISTAIPSVMTLENIDETMPISDESWTVIEDIYEWYDDFDDTDISTVDELKNVHLSSTQINLSQEELSQYIPFEMPRRYDNFDIALNTKLQFHYMNAEGYKDFVDAVNVKYNDEKIRFALLVPPEMTCASGKVLNEIVASGKNSKGGNYQWISRPFNFIVEQSLFEYSGKSPSISDSYTQLINKLDNKVFLAQKYAEEAKTASGLSITYDADSKYIVIR